MLTKIQYIDESDKQKIIGENIGKILREEQNLFEGNFLVFSDSIPEPLVGTLPDVQQQKIAQITDLYNQKLASGFTSSATGTPHIFGYGNSDQMKFMQLAIGVLSNIQPFPVGIPAKDNTVVSHTVEQYQLLLQDIGIFAYTMNGIQHQFIDAVNACTTIDQVNTIVVTFP